MAPAPLEQPPARRDTRHRLGGRSPLAYRLEASPYSHRARRVGAPLDNSAQSFRRPDPSASSNPPNPRRRGRGAVDNGGHPYPRGYGGIADGGRSTGGGAGEGVGFFGGR